MPGGAVVFDEAAGLGFGLRDEDLDRLTGTGGEELRLAVAHFAAMRAREAGLIAPASLEVDSANGHDDRTSPRAGDEPESAAPARVVRAAGYSDPGLRRAALEARGESLDVIPVVTRGTRLLVGPILGSSSSPCIECLARAVAPNTKLDGLLRPDTLRPTVPDFTDEEILHMARRDLGTSGPQILEVTRKARLVARHHVRSFPDCPICGQGTMDLNERCPNFASSPKVSVTDTGARVNDPQSVFAAYEHLISPISGAVRRLRRMDTGAEDLIHVFTANHASAGRAQSFAEIMRDGRDHSGGKGSSEIQARVSALCEGLERFSAIAAGNEVDRVSTLVSLEGAIDPRQCLLFSERQYERRHEWNPRQSRFQRVPEPLHEEMSIAWSRVWNLRTREQALLPTGMLYFGFEGAGAECCVADSNGLAAGHTLAEAVLQGFLEVVERDAVAMWWYNRLRMPAVAVETFRDAYVNSVIDRYAAAGRQVWVLDLTSDLKIPVFGAISARTGGVSPEVIFGFGAHLDPSIALRRCVTEMNQLLATVRRPPAERSNHLRGAYDEALRWWGEATIEDKLYLVPDSGLGRRGAECFEYADTDDLRDDLETCLEVASRQGMDVYLRNMTRPDLGISVAKVVVPGLRHFWRRLAPGRLYDVPVAMGRLPRELPEDDLNPVSLFV